MAQSTDARASNRSSRIGDLPCYAGVMSAKVSRQAIELDADAWPRFERFIRDIAKAGPQHRKAKAKSKPRRVPGNELELIARNECCREVTIALWRKIKRVRVIWIEKYGIRPLLKICPCPKYCCSPHQIFPDACFTINAPTGTSVVIDEPPWTK